MALVNNNVLEIIAKSLISDCEKYITDLEKSTEVLQKQLMLKELSNDIDSEILEQINNVLAKRCSDHASLLRNINEFFHSQFQSVINFENINKYNLKNSSNKKNDQVNDQINDKEKFDKMVEVSNTVDKHTEKSDNKDIVAGIERTDVDQSTLIEELGIMNEYDRLMEKRKQLHIQNGTYEKEKDVDIADTVKDLDNTMDKMDINDHSMTANTNHVDNAQTPKKGINVDVLPVANAIHKLDWKEQENLQKNIFKKALYNVEIMLQIKRDDPSFKQKVIEEADRLLEVWKKTY